MTVVWERQLEPLELVSQNEATLELLLGMARIAEEDLEAFLDELARNDEIDVVTKAVLADVARNRPFLRALDDYAHATRLLH